MSKPEPSAEPRARVVVRGMITGRVHYFDWKSLEKARKEAKFAFSRGMLHVYVQRKGTKDE